MDFQTWLRRTRQILDPPPFTEPPTSIKLYEEIAAAVLQKPLTVVQIYSSAATAQQVNFAGDEYLIWDLYLVEQIAGLNAITYSYGFAENQDSDVREQIMGQLTAAVGARVSTLASLRLSRHPHVAAELAEEASRHRNAGVALRDDSGVASAYLDRILFMQKWFVLFHELFHARFRTHSEERQQILESARALARAVQSGRSPTSAAHNPPSVSFERGLLVLDESSSATIIDEAVKQFLDGGLTELEQEEIACDIRAARQVWQMVLAAGFDPSDDESIARGLAEVVVAHGLLSAHSRLLKIVSVYWSAFADSVRESSQNRSVDITQSVRQAFERLQSDLAVRYGAGEINLWSVFQIALEMYPDRPNLLNVFGPEFTKQAAMIEWHERYVTPEALQVLETDGVLEVFQRASLLEARLSASDALATRDDLLGWGSKPG